MTNNINFQHKMAGALDEIFLGCVNLNEIS